MFLLMGHQASVFLTCKQKFCESSFHCPFLRYSFLLVHTVHSVRNPGGPSQAALLRPGVAGVVRRLLRDCRHGVPRATLAAPADLHTHPRTAGVSHFPSVSVAPITSCFATSSTHNSCLLFIYLFFGHSCQHALFSLDPQDSGNELSCTDSVFL